MNNTKIIKILEKLEIYLKEDNRRMAIDYIELEIKKMKGGT